MIASIFYPNIVKFKSAGYLINCKRFRTKAQKITKALLRECSDKLLTNSNTFLKTIINIGYTKSEGKIKE